MRFSAFLFTILLFVSPNLGAFVAVQVYVGASCSSAPLGTAVCPCNTCVTGIGSPFYFSCSGQEVTQFNCSNSCGIFLSFFSNIVVNLLY